MMQICFKGAASNATSQGVAETIFTALDDPERLFGLDPRVDG